MICTYLSTADKAKSSLQNHWALYLLQQVLTVALISGMISYLNCLA